MTKPTPKPDIAQATPDAVAALLLPGYSPDLAWMARALNAGRVILDDLHPFSRKSKVHRTKIRTPDGHQWLTIPFVQEDRRKPIRQVRIDDRRPWLRHHLHALEFNYRNSLFFDFYEPEIRADLSLAAESELLVDAVRHLLVRQYAYLELPTFPQWASEWAGKPSAQNDTKTDAGENLYETISNKFSAVWQEPRSRHYQKPHPRAQDPDKYTLPLPEYRQHFPGFVPGCGVYDLLFEYGPDAWQILDQLR